MARKKISSDFESNKECIMRAIEANEYGTADVLNMRERAEPALLPNGAKVRVQAASVNPIDWKLRRGDFKMMTGKRPPTVPGGDFAGVVVEAGPKSQYEVGTKVWGHISAMKGGAYAEVVSVEDNDLGTLPSNLSFVDAASFPLAGLTAYQGMVQKGGLKANQTVVVNGCSGGVGVLAVQIAKALGARVIGICSTRNIALAKELGCDQVVDYTQTDVAALDHKVDLWFDTVGSQSFSSVRHQLTENGSYVTTVPSVPMLAFGSFVNLFRSQKAHGILVNSKAADMAAMGEMVEKGLLKPVIDRVYPLTEVREATRYGESGKVVGKVVLDLSSVEG
jgi:NADPH:quinone reductase-like Zn-dependent oxidoreductase